MNRAEEGVRHESDRLIENRLALWKAAGHQAAIASRNLRFPRARQCAARLRSEREENDSGRSPAETMKWRRSGIPLSHPREKGVLEEASAGKRRESRRLRHSENVLVLVEDR